MMSVRRAWFDKLTMSDRARFDKLTMSDRSS
jgi:hypothetical protein